MKTLRPVNVTEMKDVLKEYNASPYAGGKVKLVGTTLEKMIEGFKKSVDKIDDENINKLPVKVKAFLTEVFEDYAPVESAPEPPAQKVPKKKAVAAKKSVATAEAAEPTPTTATKKAPIEKSVFGHRLNSGCGTMDALLSKGATVDTLVQQSGVSKHHVMRHIKHLKDDLGVTVVEKDGVYKAHR